MAKIKEDKIPCSVCGKLIHPTLGRKVHEQSKIHQDALKNQNGATKNETEGTKTEEKTEENKTIVEKTEPVQSGISTGVKKEPDVKSGEASGEDAVDKFLGKVWDWVKSDE